MERHGLGPPVATRTPGHTRRPKPDGVPGGGVVHPRTALRSAMPNDRARQLRKSMSGGGRKLWNALRGTRCDLGRAAGPADGTP